MLCLQLKIPVLRQIKIRNISESVVLYAHAHRVNVGGHGTGVEQLWCQSVAEGR